MEKVFMGECENVRCLKKWQGGKENGNVEWNIRKARYRRKRKCEKRKTKIF